MLFRSFTKAYTLFITETLSSKKNAIVQQLVVRRKGKPVSREELETLLKVELPDYFPKSYGEKMHPDYLSVAHGFSGRVCWSGYEGVHLIGDFGEALTQAVFWRLNLPIESGQAIDFWLEYAKDTSVEIALEITVFDLKYGMPVSEKVWTFSERDLEDIVSIENNEKRPGRIFMSLKARGSGRLTVTALHDRYSRRGKGTFLPGGGRRVTSDREEVV